MNLTKTVFEDVNIELLRILDKYMNSNLNQSAANYRNSYLKIVHVVINRYTENVLENKQCKV